jgi:hypothetical protein
LSAKWRHSASHGKTWNYTLSCLPPLILLGTKAGCTHWAHLYIHFIRIVLTYPIIYGGLISSEKATFPSFPRSRNFVPKYAVVCACRSFNRTSSDNVTWCLAHFIAIHNVTFLLLSIFFKVNYLKNICILCRWGKSDLVIAQKKKESPKLWRHSWIPYKSLGG